MASRLVSSTGKMKRLSWIIFAMFMPFKSGMRTPCSRCTASLKSPFSIPYSQRSLPLSACIMNLVSWRLSYLNTFILHSQGLWSRDWHFYPVFKKTDAKMKDFFSAIISWIQLISCNSTHRKLKDWDHVLYFKLHKQLTKTMLWNNSMICYQLSTSILQKVYYLFCDFKAIIIRFVLCS